MENHCTPLPSCKPTAIECRAVSSKVVELLNELGTRQPRKCLLFVQRRLSCRVLAAMLERFTGGATASG